MPFIDPHPHETDRCVEWNGENNISPFSRGCPPERDDVGIVPYIPAELRTIQRTSARDNGFNVGVDALHRPEAHVTDRCVEWDRVNTTFPHSAQCH